MFRPNFGEAFRNVLDRLGRRTGWDRRIDQKDSFPFERRNLDERRQNKLDRRRNMADRYWSS